MSMNLKLIKFNDPLKCSVEPCDHMFLKFLLVSSKGNERKKFYDGAHSVGMAPIFTAEPSLPHSAPHSIGKMK